MGFRIPAWDACRAAVVAGTATPLERFIYGHAPISGLSHSAWGLQLAEVVETLSTADAARALFGQVGPDLVAKMQKAAEWPAHNSAHESYAVLLEEVDELWEHVKTKQRNRDIAAMRGEAIDVAAAALRFVRDICDGDRGRA